MGIISSWSHNPGLHPLWYSCNRQQQWSYKSLYIVQLINFVFVLHPEQWDPVTTWTSEHCCPKHMSYISNE